MNDANKRSRATYAWGAALAAIAVLLGYWAIASTGPDALPAPSPSGLSRSATSQSAVNPSVAVEAADSGDAAPVPSTRPSGSAVSYGAAAAAGRSVRGVVYLGHRNALPGARIIVARPGAMAGGFLGEVASDAAGRFELAWGSNWPARVDVTVSCESCVRVVLSDVDGLTSLEARLSGNVSLHGLVRAREGGRALPGVVVECSGASATTDEHGRYEMRGVTGGRGLVVASCDGWSKEEQFVKLDADGRFVADFLLEQEQTFSVQVVDAMTGASVADVRAAQQPAIKARRGELGDKRGIVVLHGRGQPPLRFRFRAAGYCETHWVYGQGVAAGETLRVPMLAAASVVGTVRGKGGEILPAATVRIVDGGEWQARLRDVVPSADRFDGESEFRAPLAAAYTKPDGSYQLFAPAGGEPIRLLASSTGRVRRVSDPIATLVAGGSARIDFELDRAYVLRGKALCNESPWKGSVQWRVAGTDDWSDRIKLSAAGAFAFGFVPAGRVDIRALDPSSRGEVARRTVQVPWPESAGPLELKWSTQSAQVAGVVRYADGSPCIGVTVRGGAAKAVTDAAGNFQLPVRSGRRTILRIARGALHADREVVAGETGVVITLPAAGVVRLRLVDAATGRAPLLGFRGYEVSWRKAGEARAPDRGPYRRIAVGTFADGVLELTCPLGDADLRLIFPDSDYQPVHLGPVAVMPAAAAPAADLPVIRVELVPGHTLWLRLDPERPMAKELRAGHRFFLLRADERAALDAIEDSNRAGRRERALRPDLGLRHRRLTFDGRPQVLKGLAPGTYSICAFPDDIVFEPEIVTVPDKSGAELRWSRR
ncbi:MAG: hypothetical protein AB8H80_14580 [Planctomycetota bacterium]